MKSLSRYVDFHGYINNSGHHFGQVPEPRSSSSAHVFGRSGWLFLLKVMHAKHARLLGCSARGIAAVKVARKGPNIALTTSPDVVVPWTKGRKKRDTSEGRRRVVQALLDVPSSEPSLASHLYVFSSVAHKRSDAQFALRYSLQHLRFHLRACNLPLAHPRLCIQLSCRVANSFLLSTNLVGRTRLKWAYT